MKPLSLQGHTRPLTRVRINYDGDLLFTAGKDKEISVWYLENGERLGTYSGHNGVVWDIDISYDTKTIVSACADPSVKVCYWFWNSDNFIFRFGMLRPERKWVSVRSAWWFDQLLNHTAEIWLLTRPMQVLWRQLLRCCTLLICATLNKWRVKEVLDKLLWILVRIAASSRIWTTLL